jgi:hypothetical protein
VIDTLKLSLTDYSISLDADLVIQPPTRNNATGELKGNFNLWDSGSGWIEGSKAFHNGEDFNLTIKPGSSPDNSSVLCLVQFSVPKVADGSNYHPTDHKGTQAALKGIGARLKSIGVKTNIKSARLSRLDAFKTIEAEEPYECYYPVLSLLRGTRMSKRDYGTTFLWANKAQEICAYDKAAEMRQRDVSTDGLPEHPLRVEWRMMNGRKIRESLGGIGTVAELLEGYGEVRSSYQRVVREQLFKRSVKELATLSASTVIAEWDFLKAANRRYWLDDWLKARGVATVMSQMDVVLEALKDAADNRMTVLRFKRKLEAAEMDAAAMNIIGPSRRSVGDLYTELKTKVLA